MKGPAPALPARTPAPALSAGERAIARSVLYAALFDYPLSLAQLRQTLIESEQTPTEILTAYELSPALQAAVEHRDGFFFPRGRHELIAERRRREARSRAFLDRHRLLLTVICALPYVDVVALSGSIAHMNLESSGDLDLFIVTRGSHVWSVAVAVVILAKLMRRRRTLCANYVVADSALDMDQEDLFTASQIVHLKPLIGQATYRRVLAANPFVGGIYRNFHAAAPGPATIRQGRVLQMAKAVVEMLCAWPSQLVEGGCRYAYRAYLKRKAPTWRSPEHVRLEPDRLKLHTQSHRRSVLARFDEVTNRLR